jgi:DoxX-like family
MKKSITILISLVWLVNGLFCKILNLVPRHQKIVGQILGNFYELLLTRTIGILECLMFLWVILRIKSTFCAIFQILIILTMNCLEFTLVPDLLLFGRFNILVAIAFCYLIYWNEYILNKKL